jgi:hypothetical protein
MKESVIERGCAKDRAFGLWGGFICTMLYADFRELLF